MNKFWLVAKHEYFRHVKRKRFLFALLSMPLFAGLIIGVGILSALVQNNSAPVGLVDSGNVFPILQAPPQRKNQLTKPSEVIKYGSEQDAKTALDSGAIQAYFILDSNYLQNGQAKMVALKQPGANVQEDVSNVLRYNLILTQPEAIRERLVVGNELIIKSADGKKEMAENNVLGFVLPILSGLLFMIAISTSGGYLLQTMVEEKENRTMEIMITSLSPQKLMAAKIIGNLAIGLTQLIVWILFGWVSILLAKQYLPIAQNMQVDLSFILLMAITFLPSLVMIGSLMAMVGAVVTEAREAQQVAGLFTLPIMLPYFFMTSIMLNPNGALSVGLSMFPLTAPISLPMRATFATVPLWQIIVTVMLLILCAVGAVWLASRAFRMGMLRYGKRLSFRELFRSSKALKSGAK
jgi:ABC-2 type transport system permease protein